jgi:hypothetical protein
LCEYLLRREWFGPVSHLQNQDPTSDSPNKLGASAAPDGSLEMHNWDAT